nr:uncharacterized protein LOC122272749 [Parasteatoda tepidariorum]
MSTQCSNKFSCKKCRGKHHDSICFKSDLNDKEEEKESKTLEEEKRSIMPKYIMHLPGMPPMMGGKGLQNPVMMNGMQMMRPSMGMPPNMSGGGMPRMGSPYSGQSMFPQGGSFPMMGQGGSRPY